MTLKRIRNEYFRFLCTYIKSILCNISPELGSCPLRIPTNAVEKEKILQYFVNVAMIPW